MTLEDLPEHRREALLWRHLLKLSYDELDQLVQQRSVRPCPWQGFKPNGTPDESMAIERVAVLGDDGRYHLCEGGRPLCAQKRRQRDPSASHRHEQWCICWTDGASYRIQAPPGAWTSTSGYHIGDHYNRTIRWLVKLTDVVADPAMVVLRQRCPDHGSRTAWPGYQGPETEIGRQRAALVAKLGSDCHACRRRPGAFTDHDHFTGRVRGLLCVFCNTHIDSCTHATKCPWGRLPQQPTGSQVEPALSQT